MLLVRELGDISETTMAGVLATAEGTESLNTRVSSKLMLFRNFESWLWLRQRQWL